MKTISVLVGIVATIFIAGCCKEKPRACIWDINAQDIVMINDSLGFSACLDFAILCKPVPESTPYIWDFGDGTIINTTKQHPSVNHAWSSAGTYTVTLTVPNGTPDTDKKIITVVPPATAPDYVGSYKNIISCYPASGDTCICTITTGGANSITIHNLFCNGSAIDFAVNGNSIIAPPPSSATDTLRGTLNPSHSYLSIGYNKLDTTTHTNILCMYQLTRQ